MAGNFQESCVWRTAGGDGTRRGLFQGRPHLAQRPKRCLNAQGAVQASVVFDENGRAFVADMSGTVQAFSAEGSLIWRVRLPAGISATPVVVPSDRQVFVGTHGGEVHALDTDRGETLWRKVLPTKSDPRILSDLLYWPQAEAVVMSSWGGRFCALAAASGEERFSWDAGISPYGTAAADRSGNLYFLRAVAGKGVEFEQVTASGQETLLHRAAEDKRGARRALITAGPLVDEDRGRVYFITNQDQGRALHAWSLTTNALLWSCRSAYAVQGTPTLCEDGTVVLADLAGGVEGVTPEGNSRFRYRTGCEYLLAGGVAGADGSFYIGDPLGVVHRLDRHGAGKAMFEAKRAIQARPSFSPDGSLFVPSTDHSVCVLANQERLTIG